MSDNVNLDPFFNQGLSMGEQGEQTPLTEEEELLVTEASPSPEPQGGEISLASTDEPTPADEAEFQALVALNAAQEEEKREAELEANRIQQDQLQKDQTMDTENLSYGVSLEDRTLTQRFLDNAESLNIVPSAIEAYAAGQGYDKDEIKKELVRRNHVSRERYQYQFEDDLIDLRKAKQDIANSEERSRRTGDAFDPSLYGLDAEGNEVVTSSTIAEIDNNFLNTLGQIQRLENWATKFEDPENFNTGDTVQFQQELYEHFDILVGQEKITQEAKENNLFAGVPSGPVSGMLTGMTVGGTAGVIGGPIGVGGGIALGGTLGGLVGSLGWLGATTAEHVSRMIMSFGGGPQLSAEELKTLQVFIPQLIEKEREKLGGHIEDQNNLNARVGFGTDYNVENAVDIDNIRMDINERQVWDDQYDDIYTELKEDGVGIYGLVRPTVRVVGDMILGADRYFDFGVFNEEYRSEMVARDQAYSQAKGELMLDDKNIHRTWSGVTKGWVDGEVSFGEMLQKTTVFAHDLTGDMILAAASLGKPVNGKLGLKKVFNTQNAYLSGMFFRGAGGYLDRIDDREDLSDAEKKILATMVGASEALLAHTFRGAERGVRGVFKKPTKNIIDEAKRRAGDASRGVVQGTAAGARKEAWKSAGRAVAGETFEESAQSLIEQNIANVFDITQNRRPQEQMNWYEFMDSGFGGLLFGMVGGRGSYRQSMAHHSIAGKREDLKTAMSVLREKIDGTPNGNLKSEYQRSLLEIQNDLNSLNSIGRGFYGRMSEKDTGKLIQLNNKLADLQDLIGETKGEEQAKHVEAFKALYNEKTTIESAVLTEADLAEIQKDRPSSDNIFETLVAASMQKSIEDVTPMETLRLRALGTVQGPNIDMDATASKEMNRLMGEYMSLREQAAKERNPKKRQALLNRAGAFKQKARKLSARTGMSGMEFVDLVGDYQNGKVLEYDEAAAQATEKSKKEGGLKKDSTVYDLGAEGDVVPMEGADNRIGARVVAAVNRLNKSWKKVLKTAGGKLHLHNTEQSFYGATEGLRKLGAVDLKTKDGARTYGIMVPNADGSFDIHLNPNELTNVKDVFEEFGHGIFLPLLRRDAITRKRLYKELLKLAGMKEDSNGRPVIIEGAEFLAAARNVVTSRSEMDHYSDLSQGLFEEEIIMKFLVDYANSPGLFKEGNKKWYVNFWRLIKGMFKKEIQAGDINPNVISFEDSLLDFAAKFSESTRGGGEYELKTRGDESVHHPAQDEDDSDAAHAREARKPFTYLEDTKLFFTETFISTNKFGTDARVAAANEKSIQVADYWHFVNWYAQMTGNGKDPSRVAKMYFVKDGKKHLVKQPKQKTNKDGTIKEYAMPKSLGQMSRIKQANLQESTELTSREQHAQFDTILDEVYEIYKTIPGVHLLKGGPLEFLPKGAPEEKGLQGAPADIEGAMIALANVKALKESGVDLADFEFKKDRWGNVNSDKNPEIFNITGEVRESQKQEALDAQEEGDAIIVTEEGTDSIDALPEAHSRESGRIRGTVRRSNSDIQENSLSVGSVLKSIKLFAADLKEVKVRDLEQTNSWGMTSYDQLTKGTFSLSHYGEVILNSGVGQIASAENNLSLSHATKSERQKTLIKLKKAFDEGSEVFHVFINLNGHKGVFYNPSLFKALTENLILAGMDPSNSLSAKEALDLIKAGLKATASSQAGAVDTGATGLELIQRSGVLSEERFNSLSEMKTIEDAYELLKAYNSPGVGTFMSRKEFFKQGNFLTPSLRKHGLPTQKDLYENLIEENYVDHSKENKSKNIFPAGTITSVMTINLNEVFNNDGTVNQQALNQEDGTPFGWQVLGLQSLRRLSIPRSSQLIANVDATTASKEFVLSESLDSDQLSSREESEAGRIEGKELQQEAIRKDKKFKKANKGKKYSDVAIERHETKRKLIEQAAADLQEDVDSGAVSKDYAAGQQEILTKMLLDADKALGKDSANEGKIGQKKSVEAHAREQRRNNLPEGGTAWNLAKQSGVDRAISNFKQKIVDKYEDILNIQSQIEKQRGGILSKEEDFKMAEELMYGKAANDLDLLENKVKELTSLMKELGVKEADLTKYLYALHVPERNALVLKRDGVEDGSGKTNAWAAQTLTELAPQKANLEKAAKYVREIIKNTRKTYVRLGMHTQAEIDAWEDMFEHYIPLSGLAKDEENDVVSPYPTGGHGLSVTSSMVKKAAGRKSAAENLVAQVIAQNSAAHIKGRTNESVRALYEMVKNNPNDKVWKVRSVADKENPNVIGVRVDGKQQYIWFADSSYAETLRGMNMPQTNMLIKMLRAPANWLRRSFTTLNPEFVISNFSRDIQAAVFNAAAEAEIEGGVLNGEAVVSDMLKNVAPSLKSLIKGVFHKDMDPKYKQYFEDFKADGGRTGWAYAKDLAEIAQDLQGSASKKNTAQNLLGKVKNFADTIEGVNDAFENSIRLSAYISARENGISRDKAAQFAKNITVNFNKHGEWGQTLNAIYLFFNASVQGTSRLFRSLAIGKPPVRPDGSKREWYQRMNNAQKMAAGFALFNAMLTMINQAMSDDDEDGTSFYDKIPDYVKERNLIIMYDGKNYITIPMPYGFSVFANIGSVSAEVANGSREIDEAMFFLANSFVSSFSPISFGQSEDLGKYALKAISPTVIKPLVEWATNETHFGTPVHAEQMPFGAPKPESSLSFRSPDSVKQFFSWMNEITGGTTHRSGSVDINPDSLWYVFQYYLGGAGQFVSRTGETTFKIGHKLTDTPELKLAYNDIPMLRKMYGEPSKYYDYNKYSERSDEIKVLMREYKDKDTRRSMDHYVGVQYLDKLINRTDKKLKVIRAKKRDAKNITDYPSRTMAMQNLMDEERALIMEFNKIYDARRKK